MAGKVIYLPYDGAQLAHFKIISPPSASTPRVEFNDDGVLHNLTVLDEVGTIWIKGPGYAEAPPRPDAVVITKTHLPIVDIDGIKVADQMIYLWDQEDNR